MTKRPVKLAVVGLSICLGCGVALALCAIGYTKTGHARRMLTQTINRAIPGHMTLGGHRISLVKGELALSGLFLNTASGQGVLGFDRLLVDISWAALASGRIRLQAVAVERPWVHLRVDADGRVNLSTAFRAGPRAPKPAATPRFFPLNVIVDSLSLTDGAVQYIDAAAGTRVAVGNVDLTGRGDLLKQTGSLTARLQGTDIGLPGVSTYLDDVRLETVFDKGRLDIVSAKIDGPPLNASLTGSVAHLLTDPRLDLLLDVQARMPEIRQALDITPAVSGLLAARMTVTGAWKNPDAGLDMDFSKGAVAGVPLERASARLDLRDRLVTLDRLTAKVAAGDVVLTGAVNLKAALPSGLLGAQRLLDDVAYNLSLNGTGVDLRYLPIGQAWTGAVDASLQVEGRGLSPGKMKSALSLELTGKHIETEPAHGPVDIVASAALTLDRMDVRIHPLDLQVGDAVLSADGRCDLAERTVDVNLELIAPDLGRSLAPLGLTQVTGSVNLKGRATGPLRLPTFDVDLTAKKLGFEPFSLGDVALTARLDDTGRLDVTSFRVRNKGASVDGSGNCRVLSADTGGIDPDLPLTVTATFENVAPDLFYPQDLLRGTLSGTVNARGPLKSLTADGKLAATGLIVNKYRVGDVTADARWVDGQLALDPLIIRNRQSSVRLAGSARILAPGTTTVLEDPVVDLVLTAKPVYIQDFMDGVKGSIGVTAEIKGPVTRPKGKILAEGKGMDFGFQDFSSARISARLTGEKMIVDDASAVVGAGQTLAANGWFSVDRQFDLHLSSTDISLDNIRYLANQDVAKGQVVLDVDAGGHLGNPKATGELRLKDVRVKGQPFQDVAVRLNLADNLVQVTGKLNFDLDGSYHLKKKDFSARLRFADTGLAPYFALAGYPTLDGALTGTVTAGGNAADPDRTTVDADLSNVRVSSETVALVRSGQITGSLKDRVLTLKNARLDLLTEGHMDVHGRADPGGDVNITAEARVPLGVIAPFTRAVTRPVGTVSLSAKVAGTMDKPDIRGVVTIVDAGFDLPEDAGKMHDVNGRIRLTPETVSLEDLKGQLGSGHFLAAGTVRLNRFTPESFQCKLDVDRLPLVLPDVLSVLVNGQLRLEGDPGSSRLQGRVTILDGIYQKDVNMNIIQGITARKRAPAPQPALFSDYPALKNMTLDIAVSGRSPFVVDNNLAELEIFPDLRVVGTPVAPVLTGRAQIDAGTVRYQRKKFSVTNGSVDFVNPYRIEPNIDIQGETQIRDWTIFLDVKGTLEELRFSLSSDPPAGDGDILSLLLFGRTTTEMVESEGGSAVAPEQLLAGMLASYVEKDLKTATGLDIVEVETETGDGTEGSDQVKVTIGKELSRRMTLKYAVESRGGQMGQFAIAEYKLLENILVSGFQGSRGTFGGELIFRLEFR